MKKQKTDREKEDDRYDWRERKRTNREKLKGRPPLTNPVLEAEYSSPPEGAMQAIEVLLGRGTPQVIKEDFLQVAMRYREKKVKSRRAKYLRPGQKCPLIYDADCINSFQIDVTRGRWACHCIGKNCPRRV